MAFEIYAGSEARELSKPYFGSIGDLMFRSGATKEEIRLYEENS